MSATIVEVAMFDLLIMEKIIRACPFRHRKWNLDKEGHKRFDEAATTEDQVKEDQLPSAQEVLRAIEVIESYTNGVASE